MKTNILLKDLSKEHILSMIELYKKANPPLRKEISKYETVDFIRKSLENVPYHTTILPYHGAGNKIVLSSRISPNVLNEHIHLDIIPLDDRFLDDYKRAYKLFENNYSV